MTEHKHHYQTYNRNLHADIMGIRDDCKRAHDRIDQTNIRIDQTNGRIDDMYQIIMRILEAKK